MKQLSCRHSSGPNKALQRTPTTGMEHSPTSATGTAWERTPWHATQRAALEALTKGTEPKGGRPDDSYRR
jgi:hypothetical protein